MMVFFVGFAPDGPADSWTACSGLAANDATYYTACVPEPADRELQSTKVGQYLATVGLEVRGCSDTLGFEDSLSYVGSRTPKDVEDLASMDEPARHQAKLLWSTLVEGCESKAAMLKKTCENGNGFLGWPVFKQEYAGTSAVAGKYDQGQLIISKDFVNLFRAWDTQLFWVRRCPHGFGCVEKQKRERR
eukprot:5642197-Amphidinium_carterae.1